MPSLAANRLTSAHRRDVALAGIAVRQAAAKVVAGADASNIDGWFASAVDQLVALVRGGFGQTRTLGAQYVRAHAAVEGVSVTPKPARFNRQRVVTSLRVTGPVEFKRHMSLTGSTEAALAAMRRTIVAAAERQALAGERGTVDETVRTSDEIVGWRRVLGGRGCGFCAMLASRGAVYKSAGTAGLGNQYHDNDQCSVEPLYERETEPAEVRELQRQWTRVTAGQSGEDAIRVWRRHWESAQRTSPAAAPPEPEPRPREDDEPVRRDVARGDRALVAAPAQFTTAESLGRRSGTLAWAPGSDPGWSEAEAARHVEALDSYSQKGFVAINAALRDGRVPAEARLIDEVMDRSRLTADVEVWRGVREGRGIFGDPGSLPDDLTGFEWPDAAFSSVSTNRQVAELFARPNDLRIRNGILLRLVLPEGTRAVAITAERELLLERGMSFRVVRDHGRPDGFDARVLDVEIIEPEPERPDADRVPERSGTSSRLHALLDDQPVDARQLGGGELADVRLLTFNNGQQAVEKIYGRRVRGSAREIKRQLDAEELGALVVQAVGVRAPDVARAQDGNRLLIEYVNGETGAEIVPWGASTPTSIVDSDDGRLIGLADLLMAHGDRHVGNWIRDRGRLVAIDHGEAFQFDDRFLPGSSSLGFGEYLSELQGSRIVVGTNIDLHPDDVALVRARLVALRAEFEQRGRLAWHRAMMRLLGKVERGARGTRRRLES